MKNISLNKFLPGIAWFFVLLFLICLPGDDLPKVDNWFKKIYGDKIIHAGMFSLLTYLFIYPFGKSSLLLNEKKNYFIKITLAAIIWGITTELIQKYFIPGRSFDWFDWVLDSLGAILALWAGTKQFLK